jgi:prevent-host-death family protein
MTRVGVHEAKTTLSQLLKRVAAGEDVVITNAGEPVARLVPVSGEPRRRIGVYEGRFDVPDDLDETPAEILRHVT